MAIFKKDYNKPGPGVPKNAPKKKGAARFFEILGKNFGNLVKLNFIYTLCLLPSQIFFAYCCFCYYLTITTEPVLGGVLLGGLLALIFSAVLIGPATTAVYYILGKMMRDDPGFIWHEFKHRFKSNFKNSLIPGLIYGLVVGSAFFSLFIYILLPLAATDFKQANWLYIAVYAIAFMTIGMAIPYFFIQNGYLQLKTIGLLKNSFLLAIGKFPRSFMGFLLRVGLTVGQFVLILIIFIPIFFLPIFGYIIPMLLAMMWVWPPIDKVFNIEKTLAERKKDATTEGLEESGWVDETKEIREKSKF